MKPRVNSATIESPEFDAAHFAGCPVEEDGPCACPEIERDLREEFKAMTRENY